VASTPTEHVIITAQPYLMVPYCHQHTAAQLTAAARCLQVPLLAMLTAGWLQALCNSCIAPSKIMPYVKLKTKVCPPNTCACADNGEAPVRQACCNWCALCTGITASSAAAAHSSASARKRNFRLRGVAGAGWDACRQDPRWQQAFENKSTILCFLR
jgi:hypothetical protein